MSTFEGFLNTVVMVVGMSCKTIETDMQSTECNEGSVDIGVYHLACNILHKLEIIIF